MDNYFGSALQIQVDKKLKTNPTQNLHLLIMINYISVDHSLQCDSVGAKISYYVNVCKKIVNYVDLNLHFQLNTLSSAQITIIFTQLDGTFSKPKQK